MDRNNLNSFTIYMQRRPGIYETIIYKDNIFNRNFLIQEILNNDFSKTLITVPSNFCISTNLQVLEKFLAMPIVESTGLLGNRKTCQYYRLFKKGNSDLFQDQKFFNENFGTRPVIYLNMDSTGINSFLEMIDSFRFLLRDLYVQFPYLQTSPMLSAEEINQFKKYFLVSCYLDLTKTEIINGVAFLARLLSKHFEGQKVFLLIDKYDSPISSIVLKKQFDSVLHVRDLYRQILTKTLSCNFLEKSVFAGEHCLDLFGPLARGDYIKHYKFKNGSPFWLSKGLVEENYLQDFRVTEQLITKSEDFQVLCQQLPCE